MNTKAMLKSMPVWAAVIASFLTTAPSNAALLQGYVSENSVCQQGQAASQPTQALAASASCSNSFPEILEGSWHCETVVLDSRIDTVPVGQKIASQMNFVRSQNGQVLALFQQAGWTEAQESVTELSANIYQMDKTNRFAGNANWVARSRDRYQVLDGNTMIASSLVDQYVDNTYVGSYRTSSTLVRTGSGLNEMASAYETKSDS